MSRWYMLDDDNNVIPAPEDEKGIPTPEYFEWFEKHKVVKQDLVNNSWVSTVFMGLDHSFINDHVPVVFETMIFADKDGGGRDSWRYETYQEALEGHANACKIALSYGSGIDPEELKKGAEAIQAALEKYGKDKLEEE